MISSSASIPQTQRTMDVPNDSRDSKLGLGCSIFLSHSGADKDFVRFLNEALTLIGYRVFYDEESLPKAVSVSMRNILAELKDVKLAVLVLSDAFFTRTQHPMSELTTIVAAGIRMLPIFYEFSVDQFKTKCRNREWLTTWERWVDEEVISKDVIGEWEYALKAVSDTNGLEYCKEANNTLQLRNKIVNTVCRNLKPDVRWRALGDQEMNRLCQVVSKRFAELRIQQTCTNSAVKMQNVSVSKQTMVGGMYGISGIGKSTLCRALCDFFFKEFNGRVCYIELGDHSEKAVRKRLKVTLTWLRGGSAPPQSWSNEQLWNLLKDHNQLPGSPPVFLAIDNVRAGESKDEAENYLKCGPFPSGSKIFFTAQSANVLELLVGHNTFCSWVKSFTHLSFDEARNIFFHKIYSGEHITLSAEQGRVMDECVSMCTLNKSQHDYYPMMLIGMASYMRQTSPNPLQWQGKLEELRRDGIFASSASTHGEKLERIFKLIYDSLTKDQQSMLLDLALYLPDALNQSGNAEDLKKYWLDRSYPYTDVNLTISQIADLSLVVEGQGMSAIHGGKCFHVHDLLRDFVKKEGTKSYKRVFKENQRVKLSWRPWEKRRVIKRVGILRCDFEDPTLDLSRIRKLGVLHLIHNKGLKRVRLRATAWSSLRSLIVQTSTPIKISIVKGCHHKLTNQAAYVDLVNCGITSKARLPHNISNSCLTWSNVMSLQLKNVQMYGQLGDCLGGFRQLHNLVLTDLPDMRTNLEFDRCPSIRQIELRNLPNLEAISGLENSLNLKELTIGFCDSLRSLVLLDMVAVYEVMSCKALESIEVWPSQIEDMCNVPVSDWGARLMVSHCSLTHIIGLSRIKFIRALQYNNDTQGLECSPEMVRRLFDFRECHFEQQIRTATIPCFCIDGNSLSKLVMRDVQDTSSYMLALAFISASSLENLQVFCSREEDAPCGCHGLLRQPHFDYFKMALRRLTFECTSVWDLSSLENCSLMQCLSLYGCLSARKWPDFGMMTSLKMLEVLCPGSLTYWPSGLQCHPSLQELCIMGSNQIPPEELLELVTGMDLQSPYRLCLFAALEVLVDDVYSSRKGNICIATALMAKSEKLLSIIDQMQINGFHHGPMKLTKGRFFHLLSQLLYGLWVEADCTLHECTPACAEIEGMTMMQEIQDCLQGLLSSMTMMSALLQTIPQRPAFIWDEPDCRKPNERTEIAVKCLCFRSGFAYESLVLVCCASIQKFKVSLEELNEYLPDQYVGHIVDSFFQRWENNGRLPLLLWDRVPEDHRMPSGYMLPVGSKESRMSSEMLIEHDLSGVRVADAVCRLKQLFLERDSLSTDLSLCRQFSEEVCWRKDARTVKLNELVKEMYGTYHSRAGHKSHSVRKQWHHPVGCPCARRRWHIDFHRIAFRNNACMKINETEGNFSALGMDYISALRRYGQLS